MHHQQIKRPEISKGRCHKLEKFKTTEPLMAQIYVSPLYIFVTFCWKFVLTLVVVSGPIPQIHCNLASHQISIASVPFPHVHIIWASLQMSIASGPVPTCSESSGSVPTCP